MADVAPSLRRTLAAPVDLLRGLDPAWHALFLRAAGLDLGAPDLETALLQPRAIDRTVPGFDDFAPQSDRAVWPGDPALSLVYHALASPRVHPTNDGGPADPAIYPDLAVLEAIENWIWGQAAFPTLPPDAVIATFAYEYRSGGETAHRRHADFAYSRTGVARIGQREAQWNAPARSWQSLADGEFRVMPARYAAFLAVPRRRAPDGIAVMGDPQDGDATRRFLRPLTKLFPGAVHLGGAPLTVRAREFHRAEKLRRIFVETGLTATGNLAAPPYSRDSVNTLGFVALQPLGGSVLLAPAPMPLVRLARHADGAFATFPVPPQRSLPIFDFPLNRHFSSFMIISNLLLAGIEGAADLLRLDPRIRPRNAPEFVNMRHRVDRDADGRQVLTDLNSLPAQAFTDLLHDGGFDAALFEDGTADGAVLAEVAGTALPASLPAFSIVAVPDFFPYAGQSDLQDWVEQYPSHNRMDQFKEGGPAPLSQGRLAANPTTPHPADPARSAFDRHDETMVAVVGRPYAEAAGPTRASRGSLHTTSCLTDDCSNEFAPGWDITFAADADGRFYATFGLGSPFLEDVKLCAAANAYWPAASPDAGRTFHRSPTAIPMMDAELGYHRLHPDCPEPARATGGTLGWDGEQGPFIETGTDSAGRAWSMVNYADIMRSDYVSNAEAGHVTARALRDLDSDELIARMDCLRVAIQIAGRQRVDETPLWLVYAAPVAEWAAWPVPGGPALAGRGYRYEFVLPQGKPLATDDPRRLRQAYSRRVLCQVTPDAVRWSVDGGAYRLGLA